MDGGSDCFERGGEVFNPVLTMGAQVSCLLVISHFFQLLLKPLGQPAPLAQILVRTSSNHICIYFFYLIIFNFSECFCSILIVQCGLQK